jgi:oligopeptide transport system substrate-binding protein
VDKNKIVELAAMNAVVAAYGILPPGMPGYNENLLGLEYEPDKAEQLIKDSKYGGVDNFPPIVLTTYGYGGYISGMLGGVIEQWRENLGVEVTVRQLEVEAFIYSLGQEANQIFDGSWIADYPDPQDFLDILFHSDRQNNYGHYSNPQLDSILDEAAMEQNTDTRLKMYQQAEQIIVQDAAALPLYFGQSYVLVKPHVKGYSISPLGYPELNKVSIQE